MNASTLQGCSNKGKKRIFRIMIAAALGLVLALFLVASVTSPPPANAAFPGTNGKIVFHSNRDGDNEIYAMNADGSGVTQLTNNSVTDMNPAWSPDGTKIVFDRSRDGIYVMNADGTGQARLTNSFDITPAWSPDGTKIVFSSYRDGEPNSEIYVMNADGSGQTRLTNNSVIDVEPAWSPDGTKIAFVRGAGPSVVYLMNADGSGQAQLSPSDGRMVQSPNWSPDGTKIAYGGGFGSGLTSDVYVINADGSGRTNLTPSTPADDVDPAWSPDGTKIAFMSGRDGNAEIYVMNADGSGVTRLTTNAASDAKPNWQPLPCSGTAPSLSLSLTDPEKKGYWAGYADYVARSLSVDYRISNTGSGAAYSVNMTGSTATSGAVCTTSMPVSLGNIAGGSAATATLKYNVPVGVGSFMATVNASALDACGDSYTYP